MIPTPTTAEPRGDRARTAALLLTLLALVGAACGEVRTEGAGDAAEGAPVAGGTAVICSQAAPEALNPFVSPDQGARDLAPLLFTPLIRYDEGDGVRPHLARSWSWSEDGRELTLRLRTDVEWHDGASVTGADVAWTVERAADPAYGYSGGGALSGLEAATAPDDSTVVLRFRAPPAAGLEPLVHLPLLPRHLLATAADGDPDAFRRADYHRQPVGNGPFRLEERRGDGTLIFQRVEGYPEELGRPWLNRIAFRTIAEPGALVAELETGGADACVGGASLAATAARSSRIRTLRVGPEGAQVIVLNTARSPLDDVRVRRALSEAVDRAAVAAVVSPLAQPAGAALTPGSPFHQPSLTMAEAHPVRAAALLEEAGWTAPAGGGIRRDASGRELRLQVVAPPQLEPSLTAVQAHLARVGVNLELRFMEFAALIPTIMNPATRPDAVALGLYDDRRLYPDYYDTFHSAGERNIAGYASPEVDRILERLREAPADEERETLYRELQERLAEDVPVIYTVYVPRTLVVGTSLRGLEAAPEGPFGTVAEWWRSRRGS